MTQSTPASSSSLEIWRDRLASSDTLVFSRTVSDVNQVALDDLTSANDLSKVIGHDVSMAARLLRIASSALFNRQGRTVSTINAAIVRIGFDSIRELAVSLALIEQVLNGQPHDKVTQTMGRAFHAATQAKSLASVSGEHRFEEVFAAALLLELGAMLFWAEGSEDSAALEALLSMGSPQAEAEEQALGFLLIQLSEVLADEWHLGELLKMALLTNQNKASKQTAAQASQVRCVLWGHEIASVVEQHGLTSKESSEVLARIADELDMDAAVLDDLMQKNFRETSDIADRYGASKIARTNRAKSTAAVPDAQSPAAPALQQAPLPSPQSQIAILQEIGDAINQGLSLPELVALVLKGIYEGLGFDRTYFALLSQDRKQLQCRYALGNTPPEFLNASRPLEHQDDLFVQTLASGQPRLLNPQALALHDSYVGWLSSTSCAVMPIVVQGKPIGLLYADRAASQLALDDAAYRGFQLFGQQLVSILLSVRGAAAKTG